MPKKKLDKIRGRRSQSATHQPKLLGHVAHYSLRHYNYSTEKSRVFSGTLRILTDRSRIYNYKVKLSTQDHFSRECNIFARSQSI